jgi:hypothetical protein
MLEYGYYLSIFYSVMSPALGLSVSMVGAAILAVLAVLCFMSVRATRVVYSPLLYPLGCAICYLLTQILVHGDSILTNESRSFVTWMLALVIVQSLALRLSASLCDSLVPDWHLHVAVPAGVRL